jgi:hypothetical protein
VAAPAPVAALAPAEPGAEDLDAEADEPDATGVDAAAGAALPRRGAPAPGRRKGRGETASE